MNTTTIIARDLTKQAPSSPRERLAGFAIAKRTMDKCRATLAGTVGEYHYNCPLDNQLFSFKGITAEQFKDAVQNSDNYDEVGAWLRANGDVKTPAEVKTWSEKMETLTLINDPDREKRANFVKNCTTLGLNPAKATLFDWLEADDRASLKQNSV